MKVYLTSGYGGGAQNLAVWEMDAVPDVKDTLTLPGDETTYLVHGRHWFTEPSTGRHAVRLNIGKLGA